MAIGVRMGRRKAWVLRLARLDSVAFLFRGAFLTNMRTTTAFLNVIMWGHTGIPM